MSYELGIETSGGGHDRCSRRAVGVGTIIGPGGRGRGQQLPECWRDHGRTGSLPVQRQPFAGSDSDVSAPGYRAPIASYTGSLKSDGCVAPDLGRQAGPNRRSDRRH